MDGSGERRTGSAIAEALIGESRRWSGSWLQHIDSPPTGLPKLADDPVVAGAVGDAVVVGRFSDDERDYLLLANYSATSTARVKLTWQPGVGQISAFDPDHGSFRRVASDTRHRLPPGGGVLLRIG
ncbi:MAG TPA: hypothetical protein VIP98_13780 [Microlunatus sp.]